MLPWACGAHAFNVVEHPTQEVDTCIHGWTQSVAENVKAEYDRNSQNYRKITKITKITKYYDRNLYLSLCHSVHYNRPMSPYSLLVNLLLLLLMSGTAP